MDPASFVADAAGASRAMDTPQAASPSRSFATTPADSAQSRPRRVKLFLQRPSSMDPTDGRTSEDTVLVDRGTTVGQIKAQISSTWTGRPSIEGLKLIARGRILGDAESVGEAVNAQVDDDIAHPIHVVVRPEAWTAAPPPVRPAPTASVPTPTSRSSPAPPVASALDPRNRVQCLPPSLPPLLSHYAALDRQQRARFRLQLAAADAQVAAQSLLLQGDTSNRQTTAFQRRLARWRVAERSIVQMLRDAGIWSQDLDERRKAGDKEFERYFVNGRPYLSHRIVGHQESNRWHDSAASLHYIAGAVSHVIALIQRFDPARSEDLTRPSLPVDMARLTSSGFGMPPATPFQSSGTGWRPLPPGAAAAPPPLQRQGIFAPPPNGDLPDGTRVRHIEFVINLDAVFAVIAPLIWLSIKLSFLLYLFARNASQQKRIVLIALAVAWVAWEGLTIRRRRHGERRRRDRDLRNNRADRQAAGPAQQPPDGGSEGPEPAHGQPSTANTGVAAPATPRAGGQVENRQNGEEASTSGYGLARVDGHRRSPAGVSTRASSEDRRTRGIVGRLRSHGGLFPPGAELRRRSTNRFSARYWIASFGLVGLAHEYRHLGRSRSRQFRQRSANALWKTWKHNLTTCVALFVGTLLPEVEKKRKKALERRLRMLQAVAARLDQQRDEEADLDHPSPIARASNFEDGQQGPSKEAGQTSVDGNTARLEPRPDGEVAATTASPVLLEDTDEEGNGAEGGNEAGLMLF